MNDKLYSKLSEEHKLVIEERDNLKEELIQKRKEVWDMEYKINQQIEDMTAIQNSLSAPTERKSSIDGVHGDKMFQK
jgi:phage pi2 protein 07